MEFKFGKRFSIGIFLKRVILIVFCLGWITPLLWTIYSSLRPGKMITNFSFTFDISPENYYYVFNIFPVFSYALNSLIVVAGVVTVQMITVTLAAYAIARIEFWGKPAVITLVMSQLIIPGEVLILSNYLTLRDLKLLDSLVGIMVLSFVSSMGILLLRQSYKSIPIALEEAAKLDGCNILQMLWHIYIPSCKSAYLSFAIVSINWQWNNFLWPLIIINSPDKRTLPLGLALLTKASGDAGPQWAAVTAATVITMLPLLILFIIFQKQFVKSFISSGIK